MKILNSRIPSGTPKFKVPNWQENYTDVIARSLMRFDRSYRLGLMQACFSKTQKDDGVKIYFKTTALRQYKFLMD